MTDRHHRNPQQKHRGFTVKSPQKHRDSTVKSPQFHGQNTVRCGVFTVRRFVGWIRSSGELWMPSRAYDGSPGRLATRRMMEWRLRYAIQEVTGWWTTGLLGQPVEYGQNGADVHPPMI